MFRKQTTALALAGALTALSPTFAEAGNYDRGDCENLSRSQGIQVMRHGSDTGFQQRGRLGCEFTERNGEWRVKTVYDLGNSSHHRRFESAKDRARHDTGRRIPTQPNRNNSTGSGLDDVRDALRDVNRTTRELNTIVNSLKRLGL